MFVNGLKIEQRISPQDLRGSFVDDGSARRYVDMEIGIVEDGSSTLNRLPLRVPANALTNGGKRYNIQHQRSTRLTHFLNVIRAFAHDRYNLLDNETVVFIRFTTGN